MSRFTLHIQINTFELARRASAGWHGDALAVSMLTEANTGGRRTGLDLVPVSGAEADEEPGVQVHLRRAGYPGRRTGTVRGAAGSALGRREEREQHGGLRVARAAGRSVKPARDHPWNMTVRAVLRLAEARRSRRERECMRGAPSIRSVAPRKDRRGPGPVAPLGTPAPAPRTSRTVHVC